MGGYGSGRRSSKPKVKECNSLDANQLCRDGCLRHGWNGTSTWSRRGVEVSPTGMRTSANPVLHNALRPPVSPLHTFHAWSGPL